MSSTGQAKSPAENVELIIDALADYAKETGIDLSENPFAANLEQLMSPEDILQLLGDREKAFKEYRDENRRLINCLSPIVNVFHKFSGILAKVAGLVSRMCRLVSLLT
jgi:fungal STAND N-terminal Goodbye domain